MISAKFEDEIWIYFQTNLRARTRKEYWNVIRSFDKLTGHDPLKLTRKEAMNYYNSLIEKVNSGRLSYNTAVMRLSVMKSVCTFIETYTVNHGRRYVNHFESMSLPEQDKILPKDAIPDTKEIDNLLSAALDANDNKAFLIFSLVIKMGLTNQEICNLNKEYICRNHTGHLCINMPPKNHISGALFTNIRKNRIKMRDTERLLASYTDKLVKAKKLRKHYTMQTLRHAAISYMLMGGASKDEVASYTGVTGKWMNRYDKIIADNIINVAANYNVININPSKIDKNVFE